MNKMYQLAYKILGFEDKVPWKSLTVWGLVLYTIGDQVVTTVCGQPELTFNGTLVASSEACGFAQTLIAKVGAVLTALGVRKAKKNG